MGITGLLPFVKNSCRPANIKDFAGATVAIDAYSWLHKGAFSCAEKLVKGEKTDGYVFYCIKLLNMLLDAGVKPIMVFDGCNLASKAGTEKKRRENREKTRQRGKELLCEGKIKEARECFQRCVDVTPEMAREVIQACRKKSIDCIVAPYEADAQLAYLDKIGMAQVIITEDSDLILFGCNKILFKMDAFGGGLIYEKENLPKSFGANASKFSFEKFRYMCILSGCDYLPSLPGIGLSKACKFFTLTTITDLTVVLSKLPSYLKMPRLVVPEEYKESFIKANNTFLYQLAFCPKEKRLVPINPYPEDINIDDMEYAGKYLDDDLACQLAIGNINVKTLKEFDSTGVQNSSNVFESKSIVWGSGNNLKESNISSKKEIAFKFNTPKGKVETTQKRKFIELEDKSGTSEFSAEDLFSQYSVTNAKKSKVYDLYEEDPIASCSYSSDISSSVIKEPVFEDSPTRLNLPLKKIVRSRFFSSHSTQSSIESSDSGISSLSSSFTSRSEDFLSNTEVLDTSTPIIDSEIENETFQMDQPKQNKENVINRFAKKKPTNTSPKSNASDNGIVHSTPDHDSVSVLDVFSSEASSTTSTLSSMQKSAKILSQTVTDSATKIKPKNLFSKRNTAKKLVTTKIQEFNFTKESVCKANNDKSDRDESQCNESFERSPEKNVLKSPLREISPYFLNGSDSIHCSLTSEESETVITLSDGEDIEPSNNSVKSSPKSPKKSQLRKSSPSCDNLKKCRTIGLSKKRKSNAAISRKETLLNFNFTRQPPPVKTT